MDKTDININSANDEVIISVCFKDIPENIIVDTSVETSLRDEFLLNSENELEVEKLYINGALKQTNLITHFPNAEICLNVHTKKRVELQKLVEENDLSVEDKRISSLLRKSILQSVENPTLVQTKVPIDKEGAKEIWQGLSSYLPIFELFQSDRKNEDKDNEVQDPMKVLIKELLQDEETSGKLEEVYEMIKTHSEILAKNTIEKISEMNPDIAKELKPNFEIPKWESVFKFSLDSDDGIALNKRGSGVRRLILLNFFRAEAERRRSQRNVPNVIYAFEEPETSQHPKHQELLINAFIELADSNINQVILTTHSPSIASMLPIESLRMVTSDEENRVIDEADQNLLEVIAEELGVLPNISLNDISEVRIAICLEGTNDIQFLTNLNAAIPELKNIMDLNAPGIIMIPMGGSSLQYWVNNNYLEKLNLAQLHIYDSDIGSNQERKYNKYVKLINDREKSVAYETELREFENYITPTLLAEKYPNIEVSSVSDWSRVDVPELLARFTHQKSLSKIPWDEVEEKKVQKKKGQAKKIINNDLVSQLNKESLELSGYYEEIEGWFKKAKELFEI